MEGKKRQRERNRIAAYLCISSLDSLIFWHDTVFCLIVSLVESRARWWQISSRFLRTIRSTSVIKAVFIVLFIIIHFFLPKVQSGGRQTSLPVCVAEPLGSFPVQREGNIPIKKRKVKSWPA